MSGRTRGCGCTGRAGHGPAAGIARGSAATGMPQCHPDSGAGLLEAKWVQAWVPRGVSWTGDRENCAKSVFG